MHREGVKQKVAGYAPWVLAITVLAAVIAVVFNTGAGSNRIVMSKAEETAMGQKAVPSLLAHYGGEDPDKDARQLVSEVGNDLVTNSQAAYSGYKFQFHDLADDQ